MIDTDEDCENDGGNCCGQDGIQHVDGGAEIRQGMEIPPLRLVVIKGRV